VDFNDTYLMSGGDDAVLRLWNAVDAWSQSEIANVGAVKPTQVKTLAAATTMRGGCFVVAGTADNRVCLYDMTRQGKFTTSITPHRSTISALVPFFNTAQGHGLISASHDGTFCVFLMN
jgi:hypothetical protein